MKQVDPLPTEDDDNGLAYWQTVGQHEQLGEFSPSAGTRPKDPIKPPDEQPGGTSPPTTEEAPF